MDQIREQITRVLDKQGVLSRLKAELRANVFLAINDQDIRQGGTGLGGKSDTTHRNQLVADPAGVLLLELLRELLQWCNLQFTHQVFEQEMQLGPAATLEALQQQLGPMFKSGVDQPLLLQLLKQQLSGQTWEAGPSARQPPSSRAEQQPQSAPSDAHVSMSSASQQSPSASADTTGPEAAAAGEEAVLGSPGQLQSNSMCLTGAAAGKVPSKSMSLVGHSTATVTEDSSLIGTQMEEEEDYATALLPTHHSSSDTGLDEEASSGSSTYPVDTPRLTSRPHRTPPPAAPPAAPGAAAPAPGATAQAPLSPLRPLVYHPLPPLPLGSLTRPQESQVESRVGNSWESGGHGGMAAACELSDSFGHDRSFGDSSLELQGMDSPPRATQQYGSAAAAAGMDAEVSYSSSSRGGSGSNSSSRAASPAEVGLAVEGQMHEGTAGGSVLQAAAGMKPLLAVRAPGELAPLPLVSAGIGGSATTSSSSGGLSKRTSEGLRDELLRSGLLMQQQQPLAFENGMQQQGLAAEGSTDSSAGSDSHAAAAPQTARAAAGAAARVSDGSSRAASDDGDSHDILTDSYAAAAAAAADHEGSEVSQTSNHSSDMGHAGLARDASQHGGEHSSRMSAGAHDSGSEDDSDDFGVAGQQHQQLLAAARRQLSNRSSTSQGPGQQQQQGLQGVGVMDVEVSGASLTLTGSDLDDDMISEDISLPVDALMDGSEYSALFEPAQPAGPPAAAAATGGGQQAWATSSRPSASAAGAGGALGSGAAGGLAMLRGAQQALELTDDDSDGDQPLAAAGGFVIDDDDF